MMENVNNMYKKTVSLSNDVNKRYFEYISQQDLEFEQKLNNTKSDHENKVWHMRHKNQDMIKANELI